MHRKQGLNGDFHNLLNLDSLVDIVSNNVGILVILAVFMAMFSLLEKNDQINSKTQSTENIEKLKIPWSHVSQKNILLIFLRSDRLLYLDRTLVYQRLKKISLVVNLYQNTSIWINFPLNSQSEVDTHTVLNFFLLREQGSGGISFLSVMGR